jgi:hypothetical protein
MASLWAVSAPAAAEAQQHALLGSSEILDALNADETQREALEPIYQKFMSAEKRLVLQLSGGTSFSALSTRQQSELRPKFASAVVEIDAQAVVEIRKILSDDQMTRLAQLRIQALGTAGLLSGKLEKELGISGDETDNLVKVATGFRDSFGETYKDQLAGKSRNEIESFFKQQLHETVFASLTPEQQAKYKSLAGEPAEIPEMPSLR